MPVVLSALTKSTRISSIFSRSATYVNKYIKMPTFKTIGTHNGTFHCDEVLGCFMLKLLSPDATITRSRDLGVLSTCDIVIDVGAEYNPATNRFDHHQKEFNQSMSTLVPGKKWTTKLSSAGLLYCHFGKEIIKKIVGEVENEALDSIYDKIYETFIQEIDGIDNGIEMYNGEPAYKISTNLSARLSHFNKNWNQTDFDESVAFNEAMKYAGNEFIDKVKFMANVWWPARSVVKEAIDKRFKVHKSGVVIELETFCPWENHLFELEEEMGISPPLKFLIFTDSNNSWRVRAIPIRNGSFISRTALHEKWRGLSDEEVSKVSGIDNCIFVHSSGFIGGNKTREGVIKMAVETLKNAEM